MAQFRIIAAIVTLAASIILVFDKLFTSQPIQIILETGQEVTTQTSGYFSLIETLLLIITSLLIGITATYLFYTSDADKTLSGWSQKKESEKKFEAVLPLLKDDEKKVFLELKSAKGELLQNAIVLKSGLSKVKITRVLANLERKNLILKERYGLTNKVKIRWQHQ